MNHNSQLRAAQAQYANASPPEDEDGLLGDPEQAREFVSKSHGETFTEAAYELIENWIASPQDKHAEAGALLDLKALAERYVGWCQTEDERRIADSFPDGDA